MSEKMNSNDLSKELYDAVYEKKDINYIQDLLNKGASPLWKDEFLNIALHVAAGVGYLECLVLFLKYGANVNDKDEDGKTPLHFAAWNGELECCEYLINHEANVNEKRNDGKTPLHVAAWNGK